MMEPWLDSLSEDWKSEHRSSSPAPSVFSHSQHGSVALGRSQSRIPHLANNIRKDSSTGSFLRHRSTRGQARQSNKSILRERSASSLNLPTTSGPHRYPSLPRRTSSNFSESQNSVQHHFVHEKPAQAETPEWKRRLVAGEDINSDGFDLFSPSKLEGVFKQPNSSQLQSDRVELPETGSFRKPFNLPATNPFPDQYSSYRINRSRLNLGILEEVNEDEEVEQHNLSAVSSDLARTGSLRGLVRQRVQSLERVGRSHSTPSSPRSYDAQDPRWRTISGQEELRNEFISPVTVSKQNSIRDTVLRADIDIQALKTKLQGAASEEGDRPSSSLSDSHISYVRKDTGVPFKDEPLPDLTSQSLPDDLSMGTQDFITHGGFINSRRGGRSNEASFLRKSLSLSQEPSQIEPDSRADLHFYSSPPPNSGLFNEAVDQSRLSASAPTTPQDTSVVHHTDSHLRPASSGSPLKLFGNRDTYTNNKLLRILSHWEEPEDSCEKPAGPAPPEAQETEFRMSQFGQGDLDGFGFEQNVRRPSPIAPTMVKPEDRIFKPLLPETSDISEATPESAATEGALEPDQGSTERREIISHAENDRTTKRRKTLVKEQAPPLEQEVEVKVAALGDGATYAGKKRKDARPGDQGVEADPDVLASRDLLRPKSARRTSSVSRATVVPSGDDIDQDLTPQAGNEDLTEALAAELATFAQEAAQVQNDSRKPSLATKDYMEEANKVMQFIRSRGKPKPVAALPDITEPTDVSELNPDAILDLDIEADSTKDDFSRPPSREHVPRPAQDRRHARHDSRTASYLRKYRDEDDMDALGSTSVFGTLAPASEAVILEATEPTASEELQESNPPNMRILNANDTMRKRKYSSSTVEGQQDFTQDRLAHTQQSYHSSTQQSFPTRSSASGQKGVISSGTVSIPDRVGAMTFDHDKKVWVKKLSTNDGSRRTPRQERQTMAEDDPFEDIPDLSIDEQRELQSDSRHAKSAVSQKEAVFDVHVSDVGDDAQLSPRPLPDPDASEQPHNRLAVEDDVEEIDRSSLRSKASAHEAKLHSGIPSKPPSQLKDDRKQARAVTIAFSSPVVSAVNYANLSEDDFDDLPREEDLPLDDSIIDLDAEHGEQELPQKVVLPLSTDSFRKASQVRLLSQDRVVTFQPRTISPIVEDDEERFEPEMSLVHVKASDMVTPAPPKTIAKLQKTGNKASSILCLTPLSDFSLHQVDKVRDPDQSYVDERKHPNALRQAHGSLALVVDELIKAITDAAPDELFWDQLRRMTLAPGSVSSVHGLKDYCPSLEELDMSGNKISQVGGLPPSLRILDIQNNLANDLTSWSNLRNLQYLDVSGNRLDSLEGFSSLVHLRSLNASNNQISNIDGVLDLDALLELKLSDNDLTRVDFEGCDLKRLKTLDLSHNQLEVVGNLQCLPALDELDVSHNALQNFPTSCDGTPIPIRKLRIAHNELESIALTHMRTLGHLDLDNNKIRDIQGLQSAYHLEFLSLRAQREQSDIIDLVLSTPNECRHIRLSSNLVANGTLKLPTSPQNNLRELEIAACGIAELPERFGLFFPNCRHLNANFNAIKEVDPLRKMVHLNTLLLAKNRIKTLRRTCLVMSRLPSLQQIDLRDNPLTVGFYSPASAQVADVDSARYRLPDRSEADDVAWLKVLDEVTGLKRRMIELMLTEHCKNLAQLDGLSFARERLRSEDETWNKLTGRGVLVKPTTMAVEEAGGKDGIGEDTDDGGQGPQLEVSIANDADVFNG